MNALEVLQKLPHRYPMIMLDEVEQITPTGAVGWKNVTVNEPYFRGHFPKAPVMPGVLVMESLCQLAWVWAGGTSGVRLTGIQKLRFRRPTMPGDWLRLELELLEQSEGRMTFRATASVDGQTAVAGNLAFVRAENEETITG